MVNNAGAILRPGERDKMSEETWDKTLDGNLKSAWLMIKEMVPIMKREGKGSIVNVGSVYGFLVLLLKRLLKQLCFSFR